MTRTQKLTAIAAMALVVGGGMGVAVKATRSPHDANIKIASAAGQACAEGTFEWRWNVPGSACEAKAN